MNSWKSEENRYWLLTTDDEELWVVTKDDGEEDRVVLLQIFIRARLSPVEIDRGRGCVKYAVMHPLCSTTHGRTNQLNR